MEIIEWIRFFLGALLILCGAIIFLIEMVGVFRFKYVLNRMHAAALGDTLGIACSMLGLIIMNGWNMTSLKMLFVVAFLWFSSPTASHLLARLEVTTDEEKETHYRSLSLEELAKEKTSEKE